MADPPAAGRRGLLAATAALALAVLFAPVPAPDTAPAPAVGAGALGLPVVRHAPDGTRIACSEPADCRVLEEALAVATRALDPVVPRVHRMSALTVIAPTAAGQLAVVGSRSAGVPAATTLLVSEDMVRRGVASPRDRGRVWIVVNPSVTAVDGDLTAEVLAHELVHVRTRAADLPGPLWVEEGYAVAATHRALGPEAGPTLDPATEAEAHRAPWPADDWSPTTVADYAWAGAVVEALVDDVGWGGVARWYAATAAGTPSRAAAKEIQDESPGGEDAGS